MHMIKWYAKCRHFVQGWGEGGGWVYERDFSDSTSDFEAVPGFVWINVEYKTLLPSELCVKLGRL